MQRPDQEDRLQHWEEHMHHASVWVLSWHCNSKEFLDQELNENKDDEKLNYCQWETTNREILPTFTITNKEYKEALIDVTDDLTRYSDITKLKINSSWYRMKSKATTGLKNTGSYIHLHTLGCILIGIRC